MLLCSKIYVLMDPAATVLSTDSDSCKAFLPQLWNWSSKLEPFTSSADRSEFGRIQKLEFGRIQKLFVTLYHRPK